jgi:tRNA threonylcarbamoyladenosine biosynthesis protein TsaB
MSDRTPHLLLVETSGRVGQLALAEGETVRRVRKLDEARRHARDLAPALVELLSGQGWRPADLDAVIVSRGPGSYTGLRVGLISAQVLAYATGCAVLAIDTLAVIAHQAPAAAPQVAVLADAQQGKVYVQEFVRTGAEWQPPSALTIERFDAFAQRVARETWVSGPALELYAGRLPAGQPVAAPADWHPRVESLLALGLARWQRGERDELWRLEPLYARPSAAEQQWSERRP